MGLEYSTRPELNQYEAQNHAANIKMWLHDLVDGAIVPSIVSLENIFKAIDSYFGITVLGGIKFKATAAYDWTSTHDDDFFDLQNDIKNLDSRVDALEASAGGGIIGEVRMWTAVAAPDKWMLCQGQAISRSSYAALFTVLGETFGIGDGSTTFNLPDFRGRSPIGAGQGSGLTNRALADSIGEEAHALTSGENASHTHSGPSHTHTITHTHTGPSHTHTMAHTHTGPSHTHTLAHTHNGGAHDHPVSHTHTMAHTHNISMYGMQSPYGLVSATGSSVVPQGTTATGASSAANTGQANISSTGQGGEVTSSSPSVANTGSGGTGNTGASSAANTGSGGTDNTGASSAANTGSGGTGNTGASGSGTAHNNIQPSLCINFIIYAGV